MFKRSLIVLGTVVLLQGCAAAVVAGTASAVTAANDRRTIGSQIDDNNIEIKAICETLKDMNYNVYLIDRDAKIEEIDNLREQDFEIFISNASGNSAKFHDYIIENSNNLT